MYFKCAQKFANKKKTKRKKQNADIWKRSFNVFKNICAYKSETKEEAEE